MSINAYAQKDYNYYKDLIEAISFVESNHQEKLVSKNRQHVGCLQISRIAVDEANLIAGYKKFKYNDRYSREKSIEMFLLIQNKHNKKGDIQRAIRVWNEGPYYNKKITTTRYLRKVLREYKRIKDSNI